MSEKPTFPTTEEIEQINDHADLPGGPEGVISEKNQTITDADVVSEEDNYTGLPPDISDTEELDDTGVNPVQPEEAGGVAQTGGGIADFALPGDKPYYQTSPAGPGATSRPHSQDDREIMAIGSDERAVYDF